MDIDLKFKNGAIIRVHHADTHLIRPERIVCQFYKFYVILLFILCDFVVHFMCYCCDIFVFVVIFFIVVLITITS